MSLTLRITAENEGTASLAGLIVALDRRQPLLQAGVDSLAEGIRDHFADLGNNNHATADALGATPTRFWERMRGGTVARATDTEGTVAMPREVAQRYFGGRLTPQNGSKYLTIPAAAAAYGHRAGEFSDLRFAVVRNLYGALQPALVRDQRQRGKRGKHTALGAERTSQQVMFWLTRSVNQRPDPSVLPARPVMLAYVTSGMDSFIALPPAGGARP